MAAGTLQINMNKVGMAEENITVFWCTRIGI